MKQKFREGDEVITPYGDRGIVQWAKENGQVSIKNPESGGYIVFEQNQLELHSRALHTERTEKPITEMSYEELQQELENLRSSRAQVRKNQGHKKPSKRKSTVTKEKLTKKKKTPKKSANPELEALMSKLEQLSPEDVNKINKSLEEGEEK